MGAKTRLEKAPSAVSHERRGGWKRNKLTFVG